MLHFEESFFQTEEREGFVVEEMMKRAWAVQMDLLQIVDAICSKHHMQYYADGGTMLGAIRHKGFIPWDDDIDIAMKREDYIRFREVAEKEFPGCKVHVLGKTAGFYQLHMIFMNSEVISFKDDFLRRWYGCPYVVGIDIFPLDCVPEDKEETDTLVEMIRILKKIVGVWDAEDVKENGEGSRQDMMEQVETMLNCKIDPTGDVKQQMLLLTDTLCQLYNGGGTELTCYSYLTSHDSYHFPKTCYESVDYLPFENIMVPVPTGYDTVLKAHYGDYMNPVRGDALHDYPFYKKQQECVEKHLQYEGTGK
jgi:lipopolysaccharide cholinephosphotransferase